MLASITSEQLSEWQVFTTHFHAFPDNPREAALVTSSLFNVMSAKAKATVEDFNPIVPMPRAPQSPEAGMRALRAISMAQKTRT